MLLLLCRQGERQVDWVMVGVTRVMGRSHHSRTVDSVRYATCPSLSSAARGRGTVGCGGRSVACERSAPSDATWRFRSTRRAARTTSDPAATKRTSSFSAAWCSATANLDPLESVYLWRNDELFPKRRVSHASRASLQ